MLRIKTSRLPVRRGMLVMHFLVYLLLFLSITTLSLQWATNYIVCTLNLHNRLSMIANHSFLHDSLMKDMHNAPGAVHQWYHIGPDRLVWQTSQHAIGWYVHNHILMRYEGNYDPYTQQWSTLHKTTLSSMIDALHITAIHRSGKVMLVCCMVTTQQCTTTMYAAVGSEL